MARQQTNKRQAKQGQLGIVTDVTALYIRVSTEQQAENGYGLDAQKTKLMAFCAAQGWHVDADFIFVDGGVSGKTMDRPQFQKMLDAAKRGDISRIVSVKIDRIARNLKNLLELIETLTAANVGLVCVAEQFDTSTSQGRFMLQILGAVGELERGMITDRVMGGKLEKARQGGYNGSKCPLGYNYTNNVFTIDTTESSTITRIFTEFCNGRSMAHIAATLNADGIATKNGGAWYTSTVKYVLTNGVYAGIAQYNGTETTGTHPPIISRETYEIAHNRLSALRPGRVAA